MELERVLQALRESEQTRDEIRKQEREADDKVRFNREAVCRALEDKYGDYIGKKCTITGKSASFLSDDPKGVTGYLCGFCVIDGRIIPDVTKLKKDGTRSLNRYSRWDVPEGLSITTIELAEKGGEE